MQRLSKGRNPVNQFSLQTTMRTNELLPWRKHLYQVANFSKNIYMLLYPMQMKKYFLPKNKNQREKTQESIQRYSITIGQLYEGPIRSFYIKKFNENCVYIYYHAQYDN